MENTVKSALNEAIARLLVPGRFFVAEGARLRIEHLPSTQLAWEIFQGHLLGPTQTRECRTFEAWQLWLDEECGSGSLSPSPFVSLLIDHASIHVIRHLLTYAWEAYRETPAERGLNNGEPGDDRSRSPAIESAAFESSGSGGAGTEDLGESVVILSREVERWTTELVGSVHLESLTRDDGAKKNRADDRHGTDNLAKALERRIGWYLFAAFTGTSRLAITSVESPHLVWSLGRCAWWPEPCEKFPSRPTRDPLVWLAHGLVPEFSLSARARCLEFALRAADDARLPQLRDVLVEACRKLAAHDALTESKAFPNAGESDPPAPHAVDALAPLVGEVFDVISLSPHTSFLDRLVTTLLLAAESELIGERPIAGLIGRMLRHLARHLTAFDLVTFHNRGANYPDALFLELLVRALKSLASREPGLFQNPTSEHHDDAPASRPDRRTSSDGAARASRRASSERAARHLRRGLRQAWLLTQYYAGHRVPDAPTSPGENLRVLPAPFRRVPEEQLAGPGHRTRRLFENADELWGAPTLQVALTESMRDLSDSDAELIELGMATFLDRPLGALAQLPAGSIDRTPLLSYEAFSANLARDRLRELERQGLLDATIERQLVDRLRRIGEPSTSLPSSALWGLPARQWSAAQRAGVVSLEDAAHVSDDFLFLATTQRSLREFFDLFDCSTLVSHTIGNSCLLDAARGCGRWLLIRAPAGTPDPRVHGRTQTPQAGDDSPPRLLLFNAGTGERRAEFVLPSANEPLAFVAVDGREIPRDGLHCVPTSSAARSDWFLLPRGRVDETC